MAGTPGLGGLRRVGEQSSPRLLALAARPQRGVPTSEQGVRLGALLLGLKRPRYRPNGGAVLQGVTGLASTAEVYYPYLKSQ